jgi:hypothetical protein
MTLTTALKWIGTTAGIAGALTVALNLPVSGFGYLPFLLGSLAWTWAGLRMREPSIWSLNLAFTAINLLGIWRWLI